VGGVFDYSNKNPGLTPGFSHQVAKIIGTYPSRFQGLSPKGEAKVDPRTDTISTAQPIPSASKIDLIFFD
jgi:hypothetical protein